MYFHLHMFTMFDLINAHNLTLFWKQCRFRSADFIRNQLIRIYTFYQPHEECIIMKNFTPGSTKSYFGIVKTNRKLLSAIYGTLYTKIGKILSVFLHFQLLVKNVGQVYLEFCWTNHLLRNPQCICICHVNEGFLSGENHCHRCDVYQVCV